MRQRAEGIARRMFLFTLDDAAYSLFHDEPIYADGEIVGRISSGAFGHTLGRPVGLGYARFRGLFDGKAISAMRFEIEIAGERVPATMHLRAPYDPDGARIRA